MLSHAWSIARKGIPRSGARSAIARVGAVLRIWGPLVMAHGADRDGRRSAATQPLTLVGRGRAQGRVAVAFLAYAR